MAIKKTQLYSSLWETANQLRGGMDASSYKDYVLVILFVKYVTDKYKGIKSPLFIIPEGGSFDDMRLAKNKPDIGERINTIIAKLAEANELKGVIDRTDFDDSEKLGKDKEKVEKLSKLIGIFENPYLDFSKNRSEWDDILGDVYEYFMKNFASESGKSKGQFYTPAEVSRIMAKIIWVDKATSADQTAYDPTCGSWSLLLKVASESPVNITLYGQEKDIAVSVLAKMNMILHGKPTAEIVQGNTLSEPKFKDGDKLKTYNYATANPPFSDKAWMTGVNFEHDPFQRFDDGIPPAKNGDYAFLLHLLKSLKQTGKWAIILPHWVLFRGGAEAAIRMNLIKKWYIKGIIWLPANLFYGTGIPACIIMLDKENAVNRKGIFMIDASKGYIKDGNKNRLREQDIHQIVDVFTNQKELPKYSRMVALEEIAQNEYNLNIPRYIDTQEKEDIQDINAHLHGGIPNADIKKFQWYWDTFPNLQSTIFKSIDDTYSSFIIDQDKIQDTILHNKAFESYAEKVQVVATAWKEKNLKLMMSITPDTHAKLFIKDISESLLHDFGPVPLIDGYDMYQHLMNYRDEVMQDDVYMIIENWWKAEAYRIIEKNEKTGKEKDKWWTCDLVPKQLVIDNYFDTDKKAIEDLEAQRDEVTRQIEELEEEHGGEEGILEWEDGKINKAIVAKRIKEIKSDANFKDELEILDKYLSLVEQESDLNKDIKAKEKTLDDKLLKKYPQLTEAEVKDLVVHKKWLARAFENITGEQEKVSQTLAQWLKELATRYLHTLPEIEKNVAGYESKVKAHLKEMWFSL